MERKKIFYVLTKGNWGGAQRYVYDLATTLPPDRFEVKVIVGNGQRLPEKLRRAGIPTVTLSDLGRDINPLSEIKIFFSLIKIFWREQPDIVHLNSSKIGGLGSLAARLARVPKIIFTAHGWPFNEPRNKLAKTLIWLASWITVQLSHLTIVITESELAQAAEMPWTSGKFQLVKNGIATPHFLDRNQARDKVAGTVKRGISDQTVLIGTIAELHRNKGLDYLLRALSDLEVPNWQAVIIGEGEERNALEKLIRDLGLGDRVYLPGFVDEASALLPAFDLFVLPSLKEGLPYVILEAGAAGLPVIASQVGGIPDVISDGQVGFLVKPADPQNLSRALDFLITHRNFRTELGLNLKQIVENRYSLSQMVQSLTKLYTED